MYCTVLYCTVLYCTNVVTVQGFVFCALLEFALVNYASRWDIHEALGREICISARFPYFLFMKRHFDSHCSQGGKPLQGWKVAQIQG